MAPLVKVPNRSTQYLEYSKERSNQTRFWKLTIASGQVELEHQKGFMCIYNKIVGFQSIIIEGSGRW
jgi:hypothetical protein